MTKCRQPIFTTEQLQDEMKQISKNISDGNNSTIEKIKVMPDHVHLLLSSKLKYTPSNIVKLSKGVSAREWFKLHPETKQKL